MTLVSSVTGWVVENLGLDADMLNLVTTDYLLFYEKTHFPFYPAYINMLNSVYNLSYGIIIEYLSFSTSMIRVNMIAMGIYLLIFLFREHI